MAADVVLDTSGVFGVANWLGPGGGPARGERALRNDIEYRLPDLKRRAESHYAGKRILLVGAGYTAATNADLLVELAQQHPETKITWVTRRSDAHPIQIVENDRLPERAALTRSANQLATSGSALDFRPGNQVVSLVRAGDEIRVSLSGADAGEPTFDRVIANIGFRPHRELYTELQIHECYASEGPMKLAAAMLGQTSTDCLDQSSCGPQTLVNPEPNFYILGSKSFGRNSQFLISVGLAQIQELFTILGGRDDLNLYNSHG